LDEERKGEVRVKDAAGSVLEQRVCKSGVVESLGREGGLGYFSTQWQLKDLQV